MFRGGRNPTYQSCIAHGHPNRSYIGQLFNDLDCNCRCPYRNLEVRGIV
jgi:hypothetical protein